MTDSKMFLKNYNFYGEHADMVEKLISKIDTDSDACIFSSMIDLFIFAAVVGVYYDKKDDPSTDKSKEKTILAEQFNSHSNQLHLVFKFVTLLGNQSKYDEVKRLNMTFRNPNTDENYINFEKYMLGGLRFIYDRLMVTTNMRYDDYLSCVNELLSDISHGKKEEESIDNETLTGDFF